MLFQKHPLGLIEVKGKVVPFHAVKVYRGCTCIAPLNRNLGIRWKEWSNSHPGYFTPRKETQYPLNRWLGGPQSQCGHPGEENGLLVEALVVYVICRDSVSCCYSVHLRVLLWWMLPCRWQSKVNHWMMSREHVYNSDHNKQVTRWQSR
jgi:hypothetical protein